MLDFKLDLDLEHRQRQEQLVSAHLVQANAVLQLSSEELEQLIAREIEENPALEMQESPLCQVCGGELAGSICPRCLMRQKVDDGAERPWADEHEHRRDLPPDDEEWDPLLRVADEPSLQERLLTELWALVPEEQHPVAEYLVGSLNEDGYLTVDIRDAAEELGVPRSVVEAVLRQLQSLEPVGIGARNVRECLLLQMDYLEREHGVSHPVARKIVDNGLLSELAERDYRRVASMLGCRLADVVSAVRFITTELNPYPARGDSGPDHRMRQARTAMRFPDVVIVKEHGDYRVEVVESSRFSLQVSPAYADMAREMRSDPGRFSDHDRRHVREYVERARMFVKNVRQRHETIRKIAECLVREQREFLERGPSGLKPLTRARVAQLLGFHESTVSRAIAGKYVMLPDRRVVPMSDFVTPSLAPKEVLKSILRQEPHLTDEEVAHRMRQQGVTVARRTVTKYRGQLGIPHSRRRTA